jgi:heme exporter protein C
MRADLRAEPLARFRFYRFAAPATFFALAGRWIPRLAVVATLLAAAGLYVGFFVAPTDAQQGDAYRIIYIHVPAAWMAMFLYLVMAFWAGVGLAFNTRVSSMLALAVAPTGALMAAIALWTGALWGRPMWGAYWVWDARLTSTLILLFLYAGFLSLHAAIDDTRRADRACAVLALVGAINVPIIYFSVQWWNTLHQGATISMVRAPSIARPMLLALLLMALAAWAYSIAMTLSRARVIVLEREHDSGWVRDWLRYDR